MKKKHKGYIIKVIFWGDSITPMYKYKLYKPRKYWFPKLLWVEDVHRNRIGSKISNKFDWLIEQYKLALERWS